MGFQTALIVDDSKLARVTLKKKLESHGLEVNVADSAEQAFESLLSINPDIIFMDHLMPGIDGFEATQHIRKMNGFELTPIVMCTGKEHEGYLQEALAIGAHFILSKPPADEALEAILFGSSAVAVELSQVVSGEGLIDKESTKVTEENNPIVDVGDYMADSLNISGSKEKEIIDLAVMPETDTADFMSNSEPQVFSGEESVAEKAPLINQPQVTNEDIRQICAEIIQAERMGLMVDILANIPEPEFPEIPAPVVNMDAILSTVNASVSHQLAVHASTLKTELKQEIEAAVTNMMDQDIQGILDLRLNVILAEKFAQTNSKIEKMEILINKQQSHEAPAMDIPLVLQQPDGVNARIEQLMEEQLHLKKSLKIYQFISIASVLMGVAAIILSVR